MVVVGYPATPLIESRVRFCVSASHTRKDLEVSLEIVKEVCPLSAFIVTFSHTFSL